MALHTYTPTEWKNAPDHKTTPVNANNLNNIEDGIANAYTDIEDITTGDIGIAFDNTGTDLSSTNIEDAIKEVNAKTQHGIAELWKNTNISTAFAGQAIQIQNFDTNKYDSIWIAVEIALGETGGTEMYAFDTDVLNIPGYTGSITMLQLASNKMYRLSRSISFSLSGTTLTITIGDSYQFVLNTYGSSGSTTTNNNSCIPIRILGLIHND